MPYQIKTCIRELIQRKNGVLTTNLSDYLADNIRMDYSYLSSLFSENERHTIENFFISQKIERVKELLVYNDMQLSEIAYLMNYSSVAQLSNQFKKNTGLSPGQFKRMTDKHRKPIQTVATRNILASEH